MPQLVFRGIKEKEALKINKDLTDELSEITGTQQVDFTFKLDESKYMFNGEFVEPFPFVDVYWFERPQEMQNACAKAITKYFSDVGYPEVEVIFHMLYPKMYYVEGEHL